MDIELVIDESDATPPYEQLRSQIELFIRRGDLVAGARLPPLRQLAGDLGLATGTVARAYRELETAGLTETSRGGGTRVAKAVEVFTDKEVEQRLAQLAEQFVTAARGLNQGDNAIVDAVRRAL